MSKYKKRNDHFVIGVLLIVLLFIGFIFLAIYVEYICMPRDVEIEIGNSKYVLSKEAQEYFIIVDASDYEKTKSIIIIEEPHYDLEVQYNLYKGLEIFFNDNPTLANKTIFLSEGLPSTQSLSTRPLVEVEPTPSEELIREVLGSYLITGYIAYEWKYQRNIPIVGTEDKRLYDLSAKLWLETQQKNEDQEISQLWTFTVTARNRNIVDVLVKTKMYENPILFVGGRHLDKQDEDDYQKVKESLDAELSFLKNYENSGLYDYLKKEKIGYTFIRAQSRPISEEEYERNINTYIRLFKAQQSGDYKGYIASFIWDHYGASLNDGVTVTPSTEAVASFVMALAEAKGKGNRTPSKGEPGTEKEFPNPEGGKTTRIYGPDGKATKDIDHGHDHGSGDPHIHDWDWTKPDGEKRRPGRAPEPGEVP